MYLQFAGVPHGLSIMIYVPAVCCLCTTWNGGFFIMYQQFAPLCTDSLQAHRPEDAAGRTAVVIVSARSEIQTLWNNGYFGTVVVDNRSN